MEEATNVGCVAAEQAAPAGHSEQLSLRGDEGTLKLALQFILGGALPRPQRIDEAYFDTLEGALLANSLRYCVITRRAHYFARIEFPANGEFSNASEFEIPVPSIDLGCLPENVSQRLRDTVGDAHLVTRFEISVTRRARAIAVEKMKVQASLDIGQINVQAKHEKFKELTLTLISGDPGSFYDWVTSLLTKFNLRLEMRTPFERGLSICGLRTPTARRSQSPVAKEGITVDELIGATVDECIAHFVENWKLFDASDVPEGIHQMRVALRRLRSALSIFNRSFPHVAFGVHREAAKNIATALGRTREIDVFRVDVEQGPIAYMGPDPSFDALLAVAAVERQAASLAAHQTLSDTGTSVFLTQMKAFVARRGWRSSLKTTELSLLLAPGASYAADVLERLDRRALKRGRKLIQMPAVERHEVRIALKNLRYAAEFFGASFNAEEVKKYVRSIARLQDSLGAYNDAVAAQAIVSTLEASGGSSVAKAAGAVDGWSRRGALEADHQLGVLWNNFRRRNRFW